jgi:hypothetical protein
MKIDVSAADERVSARAETCDWTAGEASAGVTDAATALRAMTEPARSLAPR